DGIRDDLVTGVQTCALPISDLFDHRDEILRKFRSEDFQRYKTTVASNVLGWDNPAGVQRLASCLGEQVSYSYDAARVRRHGNRRSEERRVGKGGRSDVPQKV